MHVRSLLGAVGVWMSSLAAGTWILPTLALLPSSQAEAAPLIAQRGGDDPALEWARRFERNATGVAWALASGQSSTRSLAIVQTAGVGAHIVDFYDLPRAKTAEEAIRASDLVGQAVWDEAVSAPIFRAAVGQTAGMDPATIPFVDLRIAAGTLQGGKGTTPAAFTSLMMDIYLPSERGGIPEYRGSWIAPLESAKSLEQAREPVDSMAATLAANGAASALDLGSTTGGGNAGGGGGPGGGSGLTCMNPNWVGNNGYQCCPAYLNYQLALDNCLYAMGRAMLACLQGFVSNIGNGIGAAIANCLKLCVPIAGFFGPAAAKAFGICFLACLGLYQLGNQCLFFACLADSVLAWRQCRIDAERDYINRLVDHGCWPPPAGYEP